jgi:DsbC/DsbD-like thiol-disulfide interchange protein
MIRGFICFLFLIRMLVAEEPGLVGPGLSVELISENFTISSGKDFTVGLHLHHFPGFHTYWQNPGMVGMAPSLEWTLPEGFKASEIQWPHPEHTFMGEYPCYGYERDVTLLVTITPPKIIHAKKVSLCADAAWMCCSKGCFPGYETFTLELPVARTLSPNPKATELIQKAREELPSRKHDARLELLSKTNSKKIKVRLTAPGIGEAQKVHLFSTDRQISSDHPQVISKESQDSLLLEVPRSEFGPEDPKNLPAVLQIDDQFLSLNGIYPN